MIASSNFLGGAPFTWISIMLRFGLKNAEAPEYQGIQAKDNDLWVAIEVDTHDVLEASREQLKACLTIAILRSLIDIGRKYKLPYGPFQAMLDGTAKSHATDIK